MPYAHEGQGDEVIKERLKELAYKRNTFGYRRLHALLKREGFAVNHKMVYRLYKEENLCKRKERKRRHPIRYKQPLEVALKPNQRWAMDFTSDTFGMSRKLRALNIVDICTRECPSIEVSGSLPSVKVISALNKLADERGLPKAITVDNGPEYTSRAILSETGQRRTE